MEFYPQNARNDAPFTSCTALFADHIVLLPAVSTANLGQLTLDLMINTLLPTENAFNVEMTCVGHLLSNEMPPIAGNAAFATEQPHPLCLNLEVYQSKEKKLTIIQQRALVVPGRARAFVRELVEWASLNKVATLGVVAGCDDMLRHDLNMMSRPIRTIYSAIATQLENSFLTRFEKLTTNADGASEVVEPHLSSAKDQWKSIRGAGLAPLLHAQCDEEKLPFIAWVMPCAEGNNVPDAVAMATQLFHYLRITAKHLTADPSAVSILMPPMLPFALPPSWNQLFGRGPDVSLYL